MLQRALISALLASLACLTICATPATLGQDPEPPDPEEPGEIIREILKLQRRIDNLMALLPLDRRAEVEEILASRRDEPTEPVEVVEAAAAVPSTDQDGGEDAAGFRSTITVVGKDECNLLRPFDFDDDDLISSRDRYWRYLALWRDVNRDGQPQEAELTDLYDAGIQDVSVELDSFRYADGGSGRVDLGRWVRVGVGGGPFGEAPILTVDTTRLARGTGPAVLPRDSDEPLEGIQPIEPGWRLRWRDGKVLVLTCS